MTRFFLTKNAGKPVVSGGKSFRFEAAEYFEPSGSWWGTLAADDPADIEKLHAAAAAGKVTEISEEEFSTYEVKKKQTRSSGNIVNLRNWQSPKSSVLSGKPVEVVDEPAQAKITETVADALVESVPVKPPVRRNRK